MRYLEFARAQGDVLIVGLNTDESVAASKGAGRPVNPAADRAAVLAGLSSVDHVVTFHEDVPEALIREIEPDVLVKGEDWKDKGVVGREFVEGRGGKVVLASLLGGRSTTRTLARLAARDGAPSKKPAAVRKGAPAPASSRAARGKGGRRGGA